MRDALENTTEVLLYYELYPNQYYSMVHGQPTPALHLSLSHFLSLSSSSSLGPHLGVFGTSGQAAYEAAHILHAPLADVLHRVCCGRVLPIHEKTSHGP